MTKATTAPPDRFQSRVHQSWEAQRANERRISASASASD
jgi:hypothetical protein